MSLHLVTYDLRKPDRNYNDLYDAIKALGSNTHALESVWLVRTTLDTGDIRDRLKGAIDANDVLLVTELTGAWSSWNLPAAAVEWLKSSS